MDELYHHGIKGMHWGVRHDENKTKYKAAQKRLDRQLNEYHDEYRAKLKEGRKTYNQAKKLNKRLEKAGKLRDGEYEANKKSGKSQYSNWLESEENKLFIHAYQTEKAKQLNKMKYAEITKGKNSSAYKRGKRIYEHTGVNYQNAYIYKDKNGKYNITRFV